MGFLKDNHGMTMLPAIPAEGQCAACGEYHDPGMPHNRDSLRYQYTFYDENGRWPSWADAMAHCEGEVQAAWRAELARRGVDVGEVPGTAVLEVDVSIGGEGGACNG